MRSKLRIDRIRIFLLVATTALVAGTFVGWLTVFGEVDRYCDATGEGLWSLRYLTGSIVTNPLLTPCFWGSIVFVVALVWALNLLFDKNPASKSKSIRNLWWLLLGGTLFALVNNVPVIYDFYTKPKGTVIGCSADAITTPFTTGCFLGFASFAAAFVFIAVTLWSIRKSQK